MDQLPPAEQAALGEALQEAIYGIHALTEEEREAHKSWSEVSHHTSNRQHRLMFGFQKDGSLRVQSGTNDSWQAIMRREGDVKSGTWTTAGSRAEHAYADGVTEWYHNGPEGMEHGFTLERRPASAGKKGFELAMALEGLSVGEDPQRDGDLVFSDESAEMPVLGYQGLKVWDATGRELTARMFPRGTGLCIAVNDVAAVYPVTIDPLIVSLEQTLGEPVRNPMTYMKASNPWSFSQFGRSLAMHGDTIVVGADGEKSAATGVNAHPGAYPLFDAGAAYVFVRSGSTWVQQAYLKASNTESWDLFGCSVSIFGDTIVVGAHGESSAATGINGSQTNNSANNAGAAYVFTRSGTTWTQQAYLKASNTDAADRFGFSVAITGETIVVGAPGEASNATGVNGNQANNSVLGTGAAYVFTRSGTTWSQQAYLKASNRGGSFGSSVAISNASIVVGAPNESNSSTGVNGNQNITTMQLSGAAYVFFRSGTTWSQEAYLKASNTGSTNYFGRSVAVSSNTIAVGAYCEESNATGINGNQNNDSAAGAGAVYVFVRSGTVWSQQAYLKASNTGALDWFGRSVAIASETIVVGAVQESSNATGINGNQTDNSATYSGAAYVFIRSGTTWSQQAYLKASNTGGSDAFGSAVAVSGSSIVVSAPGEGSNSSGINGNQADNTVASAGAAYIYESGGAASHDHFGFATDIDGDRAIIGAPDHDHIGLSATGKAWIFRRNGSSWALEAGLINHLPAAGDRFGISVGISGDRAIVGADMDDEPNIVGTMKINCGSASTFQRNQDGGWSLSNKSSQAPAGSSYGRAVAIDGNRIAVGAPLEDGASGRVYTWGTGLAQTLSAPTSQSGSYFGYSLAISGNTLMVGSPRRNNGSTGDTGAVYFFKPDNFFDMWAADGSISPNIARLCAGFSVALHGNIAVIGCGGPSGWAGTLSNTGRTGRAFVVMHDGTSWGTMPHYLDDFGFTAVAWFGMSVAVEDGVIAVGAFGNGTQTGVVRVFRKEGDGWVKVEDLSVPGGESNNAFGISLSISQGRLLIGASNADTDLIDVGQSYIYTVRNPNGEVPVLAITRNGGNVVITWPPTPGWTLWSSSSLEPSSWTPVSVSTDGNHSYPISSAAKMFFRLQNP